MGLWDRFVASRSSGGLTGVLPMSEPLGQRGDWELARLSLQEAIETPVVVAASSSTHRRTSSAEMISWRWWPPSRSSTVRTILERLAVTVFQASRILDPYRAS